MYFTTSEFDSLGEKEIRDFLNLGISEFYYLDYKQTLKYNSHFKSEFLKDISAFANGYGGNLLFGIKEPQEGQSVDDQIVGIEDAEAVLSKFEKLAQVGLDPRIPGFKMKLITIEDNNPIMLAHIPPSITKPHMIIKGDKKGSFYKRGIESNQKMNTEQIKNSVITSFNVETEILDKLEKKESTFKDYDLSDQPTFFFQAIPLIKHSIDDRLNPDEVRDAYHIQEANPPHYDLVQGHRFSPIMHGFKAHYNWPQHFNHVFKINHDGYMQSSLEMFPVYEDDELGSYLQANSPLIHYFRSVLTLTDRLTDKLGFDYPYLVNCKFFNANNLVHVNDLKQKSTYDYQTMEFSNFKSNYGASLLTLAHDEWITEFFNAFGKYPKKQHLIRTD
ncbi:AlbA family DNA-binding domain-containing protein [Fodinibius sp. AD559]|uniref:AlbA family DNA-binding domain-containing protein n=1 Tax=Fodinibius sp. AD559 TaxID=3424179 RepID=UPI004046E1AC